MPPPALHFETSAHMDLTRFKQGRQTLQRGARFNAKAAKCQNHWRLIVLSLRPFRRNPTGNTTLTRRLATAMKTP